MVVQYRRAGRLLLGLTLGVMVGGCERGPSLGTVHGEVTLDGQLVKEGAIRFVPVDGVAPTSGANINSGKFTAQVPVGKHKVEITAPKPTGKKNKASFTQSPEYEEVMESIPSNYNTKSNLALEVRSGSQNVRYDLKSK